MDIEGIDVAVIYWMPGRQVPMREPPLSRAPTW